MRTCGAPFRWAAVVIVALLVATACSGQSNSRPNSSPQQSIELPATSSPAQVITETASNTPEPAATTPPLVIDAPVVEPTATAEPTVAERVVPTREAEDPPPTPSEADIDGCSVPQLAQPDPNRPVYRVSLNVDATTGRVEGTVEIDFRPDLPTDRAVLRLWPNNPRAAAAGVSMVASEVRVDGSVANETVRTATLIDVPLGRELAPGELVRIGTDFVLEVPGEMRGRISRGPGYLRLGSIVPLLSWEPGVGWAEEPPTSAFAEAVSSPVADWEVEILLLGPGQVLASGTTEGDGVWRGTALRDFAISIGEFRGVSAIAMAPDPVLVEVGVLQGLPDDPEQYLAKIVAVLENFSARWGPYPWPSLTVALTPGISGGIEFPTHIMQDGGTIGRTTSHEVAHMFFYSLVGNNQARDPWIDEGLASFAEFSYEGTARSSIFIPDSVIGQAGQPMTFWETRQADYWEGVYAQTGFALQGLGSPEDIDCGLRRFLAANAYGIATTADFFEAFEPVIPDVAEKMASIGITE